MRSRYRIHEPHAAHFVTSTIVAWLPVFTTAARCDLPVQSWLHGREHKGLRIHGWVIPDNHLRGKVGMHRLLPCIAPANSVLSMPHEHGRRN